MRAFVIELSKFFKMETCGDDGERYFDERRRKLAIPMYQREYSWPEEKIKGLIRDVAVNGKFLGNVIMDEAEGRYEIVDGQNPNFEEISTSSCNAAKVQVSSRLKVWILFPNILISGGHKNVPR